MRIAVLGHDAGPNSCYRALYPARELDRRGHTIHYDGNEHPRLDRALLRRCDAVLIYRHHDEPVRALAAWLRDEGVGVVWDCDDHIGSLPPDHPGYRDFGGFRGNAMYREVLKMLQVAHVATTPSAVLAEQYRETAECVRVVENYVPDEFAAVSRKQHQGVVVGWTAAFEHQIDRDRLQLRDVFAALLDAHAELRVVTIGVSLGLRSERCEHIRHVPFPKLPHALAGFDVGIAPIADIAMNNARSNGKVKEYAVAGTPWLASPTGPYAGLGEAQGGRLVADHDWHDAVARLIARERERRKLAKRAVRWGREQTIGRHGATWEAVFIEAAARAGARRA